MKKYFQTTREDIYKTVFSDMDVKNCERLELDKILYAVSEYAVLDGTKEQILSLSPSTDVNFVRKELDCVEECDKLLYTYGIGKIEYFKNPEEILVRAEKGSALSCKELLELNALLRSARIAFESVARIADEDIKILREKCNKLYFDRGLEDDVQSKILSDDTLSDFASDRLYTIRTKIRSLNERIRETLSEYLSKDRKFLQDGIITIRNDRYVIPVKAEYKNQVKGFVHDRSQTGATFFIEPEYVLELNNELIALTIDERDEIEAILLSLSKRFGAMKEQLFKDIEILFDLDGHYARAEYAYKLHCKKQRVNVNGHLKIVKGRHPFIDPKKIVPVSIELGKDYDFFILSGANTGGKTVTLKMCGLFCLMTECGLFVPAAEGSDIPVYERVFCDVGDSQSIEENLSTFSSHLLNVINICKEVNDSSLVLIDELGGGTNPDEGQALAKAVVKYLVKMGCKGIVTTHFTPLKEFAYTLDRVENACMEFDSNTLKPLYSIKIGLAGASNALAISKRLGLNEEILNDAYGFLSEGAKNFENVLRRTEDSRIEAEEKLKKVQNLENELNERIAKVKAQSELLDKEREKISRSARVESRRIIAERTERAEEILRNIENIFQAEEITQNNLIKARTLKNQLQEICFEEEGKTPSVTAYVQADKNNLKAGLTVFVKALQSTGRVVSYSALKDEAEIICGNMKLRSKSSGLQIVGKSEAPKQKVKIVKNIPISAPLLEINVLGMTVEEALYEVDNFIDKAVTDNLEEIKVIHGVGTGRLQKAITAHLKKHKNVLSFRYGKYGEGETGVTIIKLK